MKPRPIQLKAMADVGKALRAGHKAIVIVAPTGFGKTFLLAMIVARFVAQGKRIAWGAHREELLIQAGKALAACGVRFGMHGLNRDAPVQLGSYQEWSAREAAPDADVFIADEVHHLGDKVSWQRISAAYKAAGKILIGGTATPARGDGGALPDFDCIVPAAQISDLVKLGLLVPLRWRGPSATLASQKIAQKPVEAYLAEGPNRHAVVFSPNMRAANAYLQDFLAADIRAALVEGSMPTEARAETLRRFAENDGIDVLVNVHLLTEGWDAPICDCVIMARGCSSPVLWIQSTGRGLRPRCGCGKLARGEICSCLKADCLLLDLRGIAHELGRPDAEATYSLEGAGIVLAQDSALTGERLCKVCKVPLPPGEMVCTSCGKDHSPPVPKSVNAPLTDWDRKWEAARAAVQPSNVVIGLAGILRKADEAAKNGKPWKGSAIHTRVRFSMAWMRRPPSPQEWAAARNLLNAAERFEPEQGRLTT